jgi:hypothetical protein
MFVRSFGKLVKEYDSMTSQIGRLTLLTEDFGRAAYDVLGEREFIEWRKQKVTGSITSDDINKMVTDDYSELWKK